MTIQHPMYPAGMFPAAIESTGVFYADAALVLTQNETAALATLQRLRSEAAAQIERLVAFLDATDGDPDLESNFEGKTQPGIPDEAEADDADAEPVLSVPETLAARFFNQERSWSLETGNPAEDEREADDGDAEPSLGATGVHELRSQVHWAAGNTDDAEDEHDGLEPCVDGEPSLGSFDRMLDQRKSWRCGPNDAFFDNSDREVDTCDEEPSLGAAEIPFVGLLLDQSWWAEGGRDDREDDAAERGEPEGMSW